MGDGCKPKNLAAIIRAAGQARGDILFEAERVLSLDAEQRFFYEQTLADMFGLKQNSKKMSTLDVMKRAGVKSGGLEDGKLYAPPSELFSKKFYGGVDNILTKWSRSGGDVNTYSTEVGQPVKRILKAIGQEIKAANNPLDLNRRLNKFGLDAKTVYEGREYLKWLADGGHTNKPNNPLASTSSKLARAQARWNIPWTIGNFIDMTRVYSHYITQPNGFANTLKGTSDALKANGGLTGLFKRSKNLEKLDLYQQAGGDERLMDNNDPFGWSVTMQKNLAYHLDKAAGGNGVDGVSKQVFDHKPWDRSRLFRVFKDENANTLVFGLARYPINEARWYLRSMKSVGRVLTGKAAKDDMLAVKQLALFTIAKEVLTGTGSNIPFPIYMALSKEEKESIAKFDEAMGLNLVKRWSKAGFNKIGIDASLDLTDYLQPLGGSLGSRLQMLPRVAGDVVTLPAKAIKKLVQGKFDEAALNGFAAGFTILNLGLGGALQSKLEPINATTITKIMKTYAKALEEEYSSDRTSREVMKAILGQRLVKKDSDNQKKASNE